MDLEIQSQHATVQPTWRQIVEARAGVLADRFPRIVRMHVTFRHGAHHRHGAEEVHVVANLPGETLSVRKDGGDTLDALHEALDAVERALGRYRADA